MSSTYKILSILIQQAGSPLHIKNRIRNKNQNQNQNKKKGKGEEVVNTHWSQQGIVIIPFSLQSGIFENQTHSHHIPHQNHSHMAQVSHMNI